MLIDSLFWLLEGRKGEAVASRKARRVTGTRRGAVNASERPRSALLRLILRSENPVTKPKVAILVPDKPKV